jgi:hypothetical protein
MAGPALASIEDLDARGVNVSDRARALAAIVDASAAIHVLTSDAWLDDDGNVVDDVPAIARTVCCAVARRILDNPSGVESVTLGSFSESRSNATADVFLKKSEERLLRRAAGTSVIGTVEMETPYAPMRYDTDDIYMDVAGSSEPLPMGPWPTSE